MLTEAQLDVMEGTEPLLVAEVRYARKSERIAVAELRVVEIQRDEAKAALSSALQKQEEFRFQLTTLREALGLLVTFVVKG